MGPPHLGENLSLDAALFGRWGFLGVCRLQPLAEIIDKPDEVLMTSALRPVCVKHPWISDIGKPAAQAFLFNKCRQAFVKSGVVFNIEKLMGQFVENHGGQLLLWAMDIGIQHRIIEPSQSGIGRHTGNECVISFLF